MEKNFRGLLVIVSVAAAAAASSTPASADSIFDVEHARATARSGRPISTHDAEYLNRWGATVGTPGWRHHYNENPYFEDYYYDEPRWFPPHYSRRW